MKKKKCNKCGEEKGVTAFHKDKTKADGFCTQCKLCNKLHRNHENDRAAYHRNKNYYKKYRDEANKFISCVRIYLGCRYCTEKEEVCLDFHHLHNKRYDITKVNSKQARLKEMAKCVCVCANCHRKIHAGLLQIMPEDVIDPMQLMHLINEQTPAIKTGVCWNSATLEN
jgi:endonuclease IV